MRPQLAKLLFAVAATAVAVGLNTTASAAITFTADLTTGQEFATPTLTTTTGAPRPLPTGSATFVLNDAQTVLTMTATIRNIDVTGTQTPDTNDNLTAAHIHAGTNNPPNNNGVVWGFFGTPDHDNNPHDLVISDLPDGGLVGGVFTSKWDLAEGAGGGLANQLVHIFAGRAYLNFHTTQNGGGEIRGALLPEPGTLSLLAVGALALLRRRCRAASRP